VRDGASPADGGLEKAALDGDRRRGAVAVRWDGAARTLGRAAPAPVIPRRGRLAASVLHHEGGTWTATLDRNLLTPVTLPAEPLAAEPLAAEPATVEMATVGPATAELATAELATAGPATAEPTTAEPATEEPATGEPATGEPAPDRPRWARARAVAGLAGLRHAALIVCYLAAGIALTWPRATYLAGRLPATRDVGGYVWGFWWMARQVTHLANPWSTGYLAAPVGTQLAYHTLMPLPGLLMTPVTLAVGPSASYNLLSIACPGLLCYVMFRAARLWLPSSFDAVVAGAFFGLSSSLAWRSWYEVNLALGALFLPMVLEASVRLRRSDGRRWGRQAVILGLLLGAAMLTDQESAVLAAVLAGLTLIPWLVRRRSIAALWPAAVAAVVAVVAASPQAIAMIQQSADGGAATPARVLAMDYNSSGAGLVQMVAPSPRLASYGLPGLASLYYEGRPSFVVIGYGAVLTLMALTGLVVAWRRPAARLLGLMWIACTALALGSSPWILDCAYRPLAGRWHGARLSLLMPYTWLVRLPALANFREADRFTELGLVAAALLAGAATGWLRAHAKPVLVVLLALGLVEAGWSGNPAGHDRVGVMPTTLPRLDGPIAADHSRSVVVDVPFGIRGGLPVDGGAFPPQTLVLATADGHPLGDAFISRIPQATLAGIAACPFYAGLMNAQGGPQSNTRASLVAAKLNARAMNVGWVLDWTGNSAVRRYLRRTGFQLAYRADGTLVYRRAALSGALPARAVLDLPRAARPHPAHTVHHGLSGWDRARWARRAHLPGAVLLDPSRLVHHPASGKPHRGRRPQARHRPRHVGPSGALPVRGSRAGRHAVEDALGHQFPDQPAQADGEADPFLGGQARQDARLERLERLPYPVGDEPALRGEVEPDVTVVSLVPPPPDPALALEAGRQPADRALFQAKRLSQLALGDAARREQRDEGAGLRS
jgi:hypothetical protein